MLVASRPWVHIVQGSSSPFVLQYLGIFLGLDNRKVIPFPPRDKNRKSTLRLYKTYAYYDVYYVGYY